MYISKRVFQRPLPVTPWEGVVECFDLPVQCIQNERGILWLTHPGFGNYGEDCLNVNVFAPEVVYCEPLISLALPSLERCLLRW